MMIIHQSIQNETFYCFMEKNVVSFLNHSLAFGQIILFSEMQLQVKMLFTDEYKMTFAT